MTVLIVVLAVVVVIGSLLALVDRRDRRRRRMVRGPRPGVKDIAARDARSNARAYDSAPIMGPDNFRRRP